MIVDFSRLADAGLPVMSFAFELSRVGLRVPFHLAGHSLGRVAGHVVRTIPDGRTWWLPEKTSRGEEKA